MLNIKITSTHQPKLIQLSDIEKEAKEILKSLSSAELTILIEKAKFCFYDGPEQNGNRGLPLTIETAQKIIKTYPDFNLVGIGRTPAWLIEIAKLIDNDPRPEKYNKIAFSGRWYQFEKTFLKPLIVTPPKKEQIAAYREYLHKMNFTPENIIQNDQLHHRKTVLVDFLQTGLSMYSFTSLILDWAEELDLKNQLQQAIIIHDLSTNERDLKESLFENLSIRLNQFHADILKSNHDDIHWRYLAESSEKYLEFFR